jgi:hypothetical protein
LSQEVLDFLERHVASVDELRILAVLADDDARWWDAKSLADRVEIRDTDAGRVLDAFARQNLLDIRISAEVLYRVRPGTPTLQEGLHAFADAYRRAPGIVTRCVRRLAR